MPVFAGLVSGTTSLTASLDLILAPINAPGIFAIGLGNQALPIPSATCQVQISPLSTNLFAITTTPTGTFNLTVPLPPGLPSGDLFGQMAIVDGTNVILSNPVQMHFP